MKSICVRILVVMSVFLILAGCGGSNGSDNQGVASTVSLSSGVTSGSSVFSTTSVSSLNTYAGMDFTLTSTSLATMITGTFVASTISVPSYTVSYTYKGNSIASDTTQYPLPSFTLACGGTIAAGGTLAYTSLPTIYPTVKQYFSTNYPTAFSSYSSNTFIYTANVKFNGVEDTTNKSLSSTTSVTLFLTR